MKSSLFRLLHEAANGNIEHVPDFVDDAMVTVVCASEGYPEAPITGKLIRGLNEAQTKQGVENLVVDAVAEASGPADGGTRVQWCPGRSPAAARFGPCGH